MGRSLVVGGGLLELLGPRQRLLRVRGDLAVDDLLLDGLGGVPARLDAGRADVMTP